MKYILQFANIILLYSYLILTSTPNCTAEDPVLDHPDDDEQCKWAKTPFLILSVLNFNTYHFNLLGPNLDLCYSNRFLHLLTVYSTLEENSILLYHKRQIPHYNWTNRIKSLLSNLVQLGWLFVIANPMVSDWGCFSHCKFHFSLGMIELSNLFGHIYSRVSSWRDWVPPHGCVSNLLCSKLLRSKLLCSKLLHLF